MHTHPIAGPLVRSIHAATLSMQHQLLSMQHQLMNIASYRQMRKGPTCYRMTGVAADYGRSDRVRCATRFAAIRAPAMRRLKERHDRSGISMNYLSLLPGAGLGGPTQSVARQFVLVPLEKSRDFCGGFSSSRLDQPIVAALQGGVVTLRPRERRRLNKEVGGDGHGDLRKGSGLPVNGTIMSCLAQMPKA
jgi:hypothetical protein